MILASMIIIIIFLFLIVVIDILGDNEERLPDFETELEESIENDN